MNLLHFLSPAMTACLQSKSNLPTNGIVGVPSQHLVQASPHKTMMAIVLKTGQVHSLQAMIWMMAFHSLQQMMWSAIFILPELGIETPFTYPPWKKKHIKVKSCHAVRPFPATCGNLPCYSQAINLLTEHQQHYSSALREWDH
jgi:hypothetical protein